MLTNGGNRAVLRSLIIVTGGGRGFGRSLVDAAALEGASVASVSRSAGPPHPSTNVRMFVADCAQDRDLQVIWPDLKAMIQKAAAVVLVNNAGYYVKKSLDTCSDDEVLRTLNSNVLAAYNVMRLVTSETTPVCVVNVVSTSALEWVVPNSDPRFKAIYAGSKRILDVLTSGCAAELPAAVRVINLHPRNINTWSQSEEPDSIVPSDLAAWVIRSALSENAWNLQRCVILPTT